MSNKNKVRLAHELLDEIKARQDLTPEQTEVLRSFLPERPKEKTLKELRHDVYDVWAGVVDNEWPEDMHCSLETWLYELHQQLKGLMGTPAAVPALPAGMRIAEHVNFGRVVVSPGVGIDRCHEIFYLDPGMSSGADISEAEPDSLTFVDSEPGHPEFLETAADYAEAPRGTVAAKDGWNAWLKETDGVWSCGGGSEGESSLAQTGKRRVLRWGWSE